MAANTTGHLPNSSVDFNTTAVIQPDIDEVISGTTAIIFFITNRITIPVMVVIGVVGNFLNALVLSRKRVWRKNSIYFYLVSIAVIDLLILLLQIPSILKDSGWLTPEQSYSKWMTYSIVVIYIAANVLKHTGTWMMVAIAIVRYIAIRQTVYAERWTSSGKSKVVLGVTFLLCLGANVPRYLEITVQESKIITDTCTYPCTKYKWKLTDFGMGEFSYIYPWVIAAVFFLLPFTLMTVFNSILIHRARKASQRLKRMTYGANKYQKRDQQTTVMLIVLVAAFFLFELPNAVLHVLLALGGSKTRETEFYKNFALISNCLSVIMASITIFLYTVFSSELRAAFVSYLCCRQGKQWDSSSILTISTGFGKKRKESGEKTVMANRVDIPIPHMTHLKYEEKHGFSQNGTQKVSFTQKKDTYIWDSPPGVVPGITKTTTGSAQSYNVSEHMTQLHFTPAEIGSHEIPIRNVHQETEFTGNHRKTPEIPPKREKNADIREDDNNTSPMLLSAKALDSGRNLGNVIMGAVGKDGNRDSMRGLGVESRHTGQDVPERDPVYQGQPYRRTIDSIDRKRMSDYDTVYNQGSYERELPRRREKSYSSEDIYHIENAENNDNPRPLYKSNNVDLAKGIYNKNEKVKNNTVPKKVSKPPPRPPKATPPSSKSDPKSQAKSPQKGIPVKKENVLFSMWL